jgi:hypothetical protein
MKKVLPASIFIVLMLILVPRILVSDSTTINKEEIRCIKLEAWLLFDNPLEKLIIQRLQVNRSANGVTVVYAYTLGGLKYAIAEVRCNSGARILWRRWLGV